MVGPMLLLKMLHCRRIEARKTNNEANSDNSSHKDSSTIIKQCVKTEKEENICRICLKEGTMPIYGSQVAEDIPEAINTFGGIDVNIDDPHPKFLCHTCKSLLQGAILFRKTAQQSDEILKKPPIEEFSDDNVSTDNYDDNTLDNDKAKKQEEHHCKKCDISFDSFKELEEHRMSDEHENKRHMCPYCHKTYAPLYFKKHLALHTKGTSYVCDVCGKKFVMQGHFTRHRLTHFYKLPYKCSLCPYKGRFKESLKMHMRSHTGERPYPCTECPARFINKSNLNKHLLTHKEEPDFKCDTCSKRFYTKRELELHFKVDHTGVKDHICKICDKAFGYRKQLMKHELKVHNRAKLRSGRMPLYLKVESMQQQGENIVTES